MDKSIVVWRPPINTITCMDALSYLRQIETGTVNCIVTSPPYWGLRDYGVDGQIGLEATIDTFINNLVMVFREAKRVLRDDGVMWINMGDSYASDSKWGGSTGGKHVAAMHGNTGIGRTKSVSGLRDKNLIGQPWRLAFALQADGWYLRSDVIWHKPTAMPESVKDRPTRDHEYVFLLTKSAHYWYDGDAIREQAKVGYNGSSFTKGKTAAAREPLAAVGKKARVESSQRNKRTVWSVSSKGFPGAHFATFPPKLITPMILAGCPPQVCANCGQPYTPIVEREFVPQSDVSKERGIKGAAGQKFGDTGAMDGWSGTPRGHTQSTIAGYEPACECCADSEPGLVLDPFMGSGTTAVVAKSNGRNFLGCDLNPEYIELANRRLDGSIKRYLLEQKSPEPMTELPLFAKVMSS